MCATKKPANLWAKFVEDESGNSNIEFALVAALVAMVLLATIETMGSNLLITYNRVLARVQTVPT